VGCRSFPPLALALQLADRLAGTWTKTESINGARLAGKDARNADRGRASAKQGDARDEGSARDPEIQTGEEEPAQDFVLRPKGTHPLLLLGLWLWRKQKIRIVEIEATSVEEEYNELLTSKRPTTATARCARHVSSDVAQAGA
jgi:hypothetical protein